MYLMALVIGGGFLTWMLFAFFPLIQEGQTSMNTTGNASLFYGWQDLSGALPLLIFGVVVLVFVFAFVAYVRRNRSQ